MTRSEALSLAMARSRAEHQPFTLWRSTQNHTSYTVLPLGTQPDEPHEPVGNVHPNSGAPR